MKKNIGSKFDDFLKEENIFDETEAIAIKRVLSYQVQQALKKKRMTKLELAKRLHTSRSSLERFLDPSNTSVTLKTLIKVAHVLEKKINLSLSS